MFTFSCLLLRSKRMHKEMYKNIQQGHLHGRKYNCNTVFVSLSYLLYIASTICGTRKQLFIITHILQDIINLKRFNLLKQQKNRKYLLPKGTYEV